MKSVPDFFISMMIILVKYQKEMKKMQHCSCYRNKTVDGAGQGY